MSADQSKIKITEEEYQNKLVGTTGSAIGAAVLSSGTAAIGIPLVLWKLRFIIPTTVETRLAVGFISAMPIGYYVALYRRTKCLEDLEKNYTH